ncbi:hypothetical protein PR003_g10731 [Phytophthora rubi]|uniref:Myb-like domain-containing protein n=1 Tax=Phytophthora rubi TaxID=129364 RepID=A0A6A4FEH5_9STRA|nr:hypothetical protein PR003_g10731 [Phytophthora rubi]
MGHGPKWRSDEDESLAASYAVAAATRRTVGGPTIWKEVRDRFNGPRGARALRNRWMIITKDVATFAECLASEGEEAGEVAIERALETFREATDRDFEFLSCWRRVRNCPKFQKQQQGERQSGTAVQVDQQAPAVTAADTATATSTATATVSATTTADTASVTAAAALETKAAALKPAPSLTTDVALLQRYLASEMRRKNDLQEDEIAMRLFGETRQSEESQRFFSLLKRKKLLLLEREVDELERSQQRRRLS